MIMGDLQLRLHLTYSLFGWTFVVWRSEPVQLGEPNRIHDSKVGYERVYYFTEPYKGTVWFWIRSGIEPISLI